MAGSEHRVRVEAEYLGLVVPGDACIGGIDRDDAPTRVGDHDGFGRGVEYDAGLAQALLVAAALRHVLQDADDALLAGRVAVSARVRFQTAWAAIAHRPEFDAHRIAALQCRVQRRRHALAVAGIDARQKEIPRFIQRDRAVAEQAAQVAVAVQLHRIALPLDHAERGGIQRLLEQLFAALHEHLDFATRKRHLYRRVQLARFARLDQIAEGPAVECAAQRIVLGVGGEEDHRYAVLRLDLQCRVYAVDRTFEVDVHQHQVGRHLADLAHRLLAAGQHRANLVAEGLQLVLQVESDDAFVLDQHQIDRERCVHVVPRTLSDAGKVMR